MTIKTLLIASSTLALMACGGSEVSEDRAELNDDEAIVAQNEGDLGADEFLSEDQPPLEGDSPFVDEADVAASRLDQENYDTGFDGPDLTPSELTDAEPDLDDAYASTDLDGNDELLDTESAALTTGGAYASRDLDGNDEFLDDESAEMTTGNMARSDVNGGMQTAGVDRSEPPVSDGVSAKQYTANNTDAYIGNDGELITGSEAAMLSGTYDLTLPDSITTANGSPTLYIQGEGNEAVGTFAGDPIEIAVTGRNFQFDAPVTMNGSSEIMTFTGTFENGQIDNGVVESQGDGTTMTWSADRTDANTTVGSTGMMDGMEREGRDVMDRTGNALDRTGNDIERGVDRAGDTIERGYENTEDAVEGAYDRATDGNEGTEAFETDPNYTPNN